ncbi:extracellular solute-binding protein [Sporanaerobium hydrogeniformans]|uniref:extracellular solute-binding protein n=1 Tax=Sporanaerobium hydrogeniformans TaxID=3072179 RepID=UPI00117A9850|nr:extracellular solute-binding protein [Sporanaerobium hydrogeniformans]
MATIKDVAVFAGVSVGSVSNVINGKTNNKELIDKVEHAIKALGFRPDANARSLKNTKTNIIGIIISNFEEQRIQVMLGAIEKELRARGYSILVKTTDNNRILEKKHIEYFIQQKVDGIIVSTAVKNKSWFTKLKTDSIPIIFADKKIDVESNMKVITIDYKEAFKQCLLWGKEQHHTKVGFILEKGIMLEEELENLSHVTEQELFYKLVGDYSSESSFKATYELLYEEPDITLLIVSSHMMTQGVKKATRILKTHKSMPSLVCIKAESWIEDEGVFEGVINVSYHQLGVKVVKQILQSVQAGNHFYTQIETIDAVFRITGSSFYNAQNSRVKNTTTLNIAILDAKVAKVLQMLTKAYEKQYGIKIHFITFGYHELWHYVTKCIQEGASYIDAFMFDLVWLEELVKRGGLEELSDLKVENEEYFADIIEEAVENHGIYNEKLYGLPFMTGTQLLFYQKDLFEDNTLKIQFQRKYGMELKLPQTWDEFNLIAEFFTRSFNANSPVTYGTSLINKGNLYNSIEFLNRLWSYGGAVISDNQVTINSNYAHIALDSYRKSYQYTNRQEIHDTWDTIADDFKHGHTAMAVLYDSYAFGINDSTESKVAGNVGSCLLPGQCPVLGGWSFGINKNSLVKDEAKKYIMWACGRRISKPFALLSGISNRQSFYADKELDGLYPWKRNVLKSYAKSRKREMLHDSKSFGIHIQLYDDIIGKEIGKALSGIQDTKETLEHIERQIKDLK